MTNQLHQKNKGFTLVELVTASGIFVILIIIVTALFSRYMYTQRRDIAEQKLLEELRLSLELFNRETRTAYGSTYFLPDGSGQSLLYRNQNKLCVHYRLRDGRLQRAESEVTGTDCRETDFNPSGYANLTGSDITISALRFDITPSTVGPDGLDRQGFVTVIISAGNEDFAGTAITAQSTVTSRQVNAFQQ